MHLPREFAFSAKAKSNFFWSFLTSARVWADSLGIPADDVSISDEAFGAALKEAEIDLNFVQRRRGFDGPSFGKIGGCILFRMCRHRVVHILPPSTDNRYADILQDVAALDAIVIDFLKIDPTNPYMCGRQLDERASRLFGRDFPYPDFMREILFILRKRHYNQETLGILFDALRAVNAASAKS